MSTKIEWAHETWNVVVGCKVVSPGCTNCYAMRFADRLARMGGKVGEKYAGLTERHNGRAVWTGKSRMDHDALLMPLKRKKPTLYFVDSMGDLFLEGVPIAFICRVFAIMAMCANHRFIILTKRSEAMRDFISARVTLLHIDAIIANEAHKYAPLCFVKGALKWPLPNVILGVSVEDQKRAAQRIPDILATPAACRIISAEPLLGALDIAAALPCPRGGPLTCGNLPGTCCECDMGRQSNHSVVGVIAGGETGPGARAMDMDWPRRLRDDCARAGVPFFFKHRGDRAGAGGGPKDTLDGRRHTDMPAACAPGIERGA